jgi:O-acetylserine/cysteine efflux transporter
VIAVALALGVAKFGLLFAAVATGLPAGMTSLVLQSQGVFSLVFAVVLLGERPERRTVAGLALSAAGIAVVGFGLRGGPVVAFGLVLAAGAAWGLSNVVTRKAAPPDMLRFIVWVSVVAAPIDAVLSLILEGPERDLAALRKITPAVVAGVAFVAYGTTLFGFGVWSALLRKYGTSTVAPFAMLAPVFALTSGALVLQQPMHLTDAVGGVIVLAGVGLGLSRPARRAVSAASAPAPAAVVSASAGPPAPAAPS